MRAEKRAKKKLQKITHLNINNKKAYINIKINKNNKLVKNINNKLIENINNKINC